MKLLLFLCFLIIMTSSCRKEFSPGQDYLAVVKAGLQDSLPAAVYQSLDLNKVTMIKIREHSMYILRIDIQHTNPSQHFVLLQTTFDGSITAGRIISIKGISDSSLNGQIVISSLRGRELTRSEIEEGYIKAFHNGRQSKRASPTSQQDPYKELPEVIIVSTYKNNTIIETTWISVMGYFNDMGGTGAYYSPYNPGGGGGGGGSYPPGVTAGTVIKVDFERSDKLGAIDINQYIKCFDNIPDAGSTCSIEILADIPVDNDPLKLFDWDNESPGHTFIQIKKQNGNMGVQQNIGFYPKTNWKSIVTPAPVAGKFADNAGHEFNASLKMNVNAAQLKEILINIQYLARFIRYDIDEYNCTDFALQVFNTTRIPKLEIPKYGIPGGETPFKTNTPQGLYQQLKIMKDKGHPEAANITIGIVKGWVGTSKGPCQ